MGEAPGGLSVVVLASAGLTGLVGCATEYWTARSGRLIHFSWQRRPRDAKPIEIDLASARVWVCREDGRPVRQQPDVGPPDEVPLQPLPDGSYVWDAGGTPMVLLALPPAVPLVAANPAPSGVWESEGRICAFWQAPATERKITFKPGNPNGPISSNVQSWQDRLGGLPSRGSPSHPIAVLIVVLAVAVIAAIVLGVVYGQVTAATWVGAGGTVIALAYTLVQTQLRSKSGEAGTYTA